MTDTVFVVDTIAALRALATPTAPPVLTTYLVRGYYAVGDGGGNTFRWNSTDTTTDNGGTIIKLTGTATGRFNSLAVQAIPRQFGAKGDGSTDDTAAFTALEAVYAGKQVDLEGLSYLVTAIPSQCVYCNGRFAIAKSTTIGGTTYNYTFYAQQVLADSYVPAAVVERDARVSSARIDFLLTQTAGLQGHCFDEVNGYIYTMHFDSSSGSEQSVISQYDANGIYPATGAALGTSLASSTLGHQGLSIELITN